MIAVPTASGYAAHLGAIARLCGALIGAIFIGALVAALSDGRPAAAIVALGWTGEAAGFVAVVAGAATLFATISDALRRSMARRRRFVLVRRRMRERSWLAHLLWLPAILIVVFADGPLVLTTLALPPILGGLVWLGALVSERARRLGIGSYAILVLAGLAIGLTA